MKSRSVARFFVFVVLVAAVIPASSIPTRLGPYVPDPIPEPGGYGSPNTPGGLCTYCAMYKCGCPPAPPGEILSAVCNCSGTNCWNSCAYIPNGE